MSSRVSSSKKTRSTQASRSTARSSKNRRKQAAKQFSLREGGAFEEQALVHELKRLIDQAQNCRQETRATLLAAVALGELAVAQSAQTALSCLLDLMNHEHPNIWPTVGHIGTHLSCRAPLPFNVDSTAAFINPGFRQGHG